MTAVGCWQNAKIAAHLDRGEVMDQRQNAGAGRLRRDLIRVNVGLGVYGGINENFVLVAGRSRWQAEGV